MNNKLNHHHHNNISVAQFFNATIKEWNHSSTGRMYIGGTIIATLSVTSLAIVKRLYNKYKQQKELQKAKELLKTNEEEECIMNNHDIKPSSTSTSTASSSSMKRLLKMCLPSLFCKPALWMSLLSIGIISKILITIKISEEIGLLGSLVTAKQWEKLWKRQLYFALWTIPAAILNALMNYGIKKLGASLRLQINKVIDNKYKSPSYVSKKILDPQQRATHDVEEVTNELSQVFYGLFRPCAEVILGSYTLAKMMGTTQLLSLYGFFFGSFLWVKWVIPTAQELTSLKGKLDGIFRDHHARIVEYSEEIELLSNDNTLNAERKLLNTSFNELDECNSNISLIEFLGNSVFNYVLRYMGILAAFTTMAPAVFSGRISDENTTQYFLTSIHVVVNVGLGLRDIIQAVKRFNTVKGLSNRIIELIDVLDESNNIKFKPIKHSHIEFKECDIENQNGEILLSKLTLNVNIGDRLLIIGDNGVGKTSIFRVLRGLWEPRNGFVGIPSLNDCYFLPCRPYIIPYLTLKQQLHYPKLDISNEFSYDEMSKVLNFVGLEQFINQWDSTSICNNLSSGEAQRLCIARMLLHKPKWLFLDECTSNCGKEFEQEFFQYLSKQKNIATITISHSEYLSKYHTKLLNINSASWSLANIQSSSSSSSS